MKRSAERGFGVKSDRSTAIRVLDLVEAVLRDPFQGPGKPEPLRYLLAGCWSRRITREHRLVYRISEERIDFLQAAIIIDPPADCLLFSPWHGIIKQTGHCVDTGFQRIVVEQSDETSLLLGRRIGNGRQPSSVWIEKCVRTSAHKLGHTHRIVANSL